MNVFIITFPFFLNSPQCGYKGILTGNENKLLFNNKLDYCTEDIAAFVGCCHALSLAKKEFKTYNIFTNSKKAKEWIENKSLKYDFIVENRTNEIIKRSQLFLFDSKKNLIINLYD